MENHKQCLFHLLLPCAWLWCSGTLLAVQVSLHQKILTLPPFQSRTRPELVLELASLSTSLVIATLYQFLVLPRRRRLFAALSLGGVALNTILLVVVLLHPSPSQPPLSNELLAQFALSTLLYQLVAFMAGAVYEANAAASRATIAERLAEAAVRRGELADLKSRQEQLLMSVLPAYLIPRVSASILAHSSTAAGSMTGSVKKEKLNKKKLKSAATIPLPTPNAVTTKPFHELFVQVHENVSILFADIVSSVFPQKRKQVEKLKKVEVHIVQVEQK